MVMVPNVEETPSLPAAATATSSTPGIATPSSSPSTTIDAKIIRERLPASHLFPSSTSTTRLLVDLLPPPVVERRTNNARPRRRSFASRSDDIRGRDNFPAGCAFSPDGTCILTATASDGKFRLYDTPFRRLEEDIKNNNRREEGGGGDEYEEADSDGAAVSAARPQHEDAENATTSTTTYSHNENYHTPSIDHGDSTRQQQSQEGSENNNQNGSRPAWRASLTSHQGGPPPPSSSSSYSWYPPMTSSSPLTSLYATCRGHSTPIHLIDAYTSRLRASYRPHNGVDEMEGPTVVEFGPDGRRLYGTGFRSDRTVAVFDVSVPGRDGMIARLGKTRRSGDGQKGVPSALAFPKLSGGGGPGNVFALGTYSPASIYVYDDRTSSDFRPAGTIVLHGGRTVVGHGRAFSRKKRRFGQVSLGDNGEEEEEEVDLFSSARVDWFQSRARGGVTQLSWAPPGSGNPYALFSASRRSDTVLSWDLRTLSGNGRSRPIGGLQSYARDGDTNQRLQFDFDDEGKRIFVGTGSKEGVVKIYDVRSGALEDTLEVGGHGDLPGKDAVNGVSYFHHPEYNGLLAVAVGSRKFDEQYSDEEDDGNDGRTREVDICPGSLQLHALKE